MQSRPTIPLRLPDQSLAMSRSTTLPSNQRSMQLAEVRNPFGITMPVATGFLGFYFACQAWSFHSGPCLGAIALSDTIDFTVL